MARKTVTLIDSLLKMDGLPGCGIEVNIYDPKRRAWLSGVPYLWSTFSDRACVFPTEDMAKAMIENFPDDLRGCEVRSH